MKKLTLTIIITLAAFVSVAGQGHTENKADQVLRGSGRVNASTLGMEIDIPLANYPGRGINVPISINYSSKLWRMEFSYLTPSGINTTGCRSVNDAKFAQDSASGWSTSLTTPYIEYVGKDNQYNDLGFPIAEDVCPSDPPTSWAPAYVRRIVVHLPGGETHELRADDSPQVYNATSQCPSDGINACDPNDFRLQHNWNRTYYAVDGSNIKYFEDSTTDTYRLRMPDGSYYDFSSSEGNDDELRTIRNGTKYTDRNGNFTTYFENTKAWVDTLGRSLTSPIASEAPAEPEIKTYSMLGMTGTYKFHWKKLKGSSAAESGLSNFSQELKYPGQSYLPTSGGNWQSRASGTYLFGSTMENLVLSGNDLFNPVVLTKIELPNGQFYKFSYNVFGIIDKISYPTGGEEKFEYTSVVPLSKSTQYNITDQTNFGVVNRKLYPVPNSDYYEWTYAAEYVGTSGYKVSTINPNGVLSERTLHQGYAACQYGCTNGTFGFDNVLAGMPYEESVFDASTPRKLMSKTLTTWASTTFTAPGSIPPSWHPRVTSTESIVYENGSGISATSKQFYAGDLGLRETPVLQNKSEQYAFVVAGSALPSVPIRTTETTYSTNSAYLDQNMAGLMTSSQVLDSASIVVSRTETLYDESGRSPGTRGNPTTTRVWDSTKGLVTNSDAYISTSARFDTYGNQYESTDAKGNTTTTAYDSTYNAYPVQVTSPIPSDGTYGSGTAFVTTATYDWLTGLPLTTTDANGIESRITYDPVTLRPMNTKTYFNNVQVGSMAETIYHDEPNNYWVKNRAQIDSDKWSESITYFDGLGRAYKAEEINSNGNVFVEKEFDSDGRVKRVSNPFRSGETKVWTTNVYDEASRVKEVILQDGATVKTDYGVSVSAPLGISKQITDQAGKKRKGISDALGRMVRVVEDPSGQALNTDYVFDTLGNLRKTIQGDQNRYFMHDSLGRLMFAKQPEQDTRGAFVATDPVTGNTSWSAKYEYDDNGNITKTTDANGIYIEGSYDNFNRIKTRNYSDATPDVEFYYDGKYRDINDNLLTATGSVKGKTTGVKSSVSKTNYPSFDDLGRLLTHQQITDGQTYGTSYTYNMSGGLVSETYPSNRTVNYETNADGDLSRVWGQKASTISTYANAFNYNTSGAVEKMRLGNGKWETAQYNSRMQITQIGLGSGSTDDSLLKLEYGYGTNTQNNGNLRTQKISFNGLTQPFEQTYTYDDLNRLQIAEEKVLGSTTWKQTFIIDRYGNREFDAANTTTLGSCPQTVCNPDISASNNRFSISQGYSYDSNGSVTQDSSGQRFGYDAENHQKEFFATGNNSTTPDATYTYDGEGRRVKKISSTETTVFVYNASGQLVAEYSTQIAQTPQISYLTTDHLGSPRVVTDQLGVVKDRKDFSAFGEETLTAHRVGNAQYSAGDQLRKNYTGYEKDSESGLEFAQARYYNPKHGRFTSIDPLTASANVKNPQTFNRYSYVLNSPYKYTDPLGLLPMRDYDTGSCEASNSSCSDEWGSHQWSEPEAPAQHEQAHTQEGVAENDETAHSDQPDAEKPQPPPAPTADQNAEQPVNVASTACTVCIEVTPGTTKIYKGEKIFQPDGKPLMEATTDSNGQPSERQVQAGFGPGAVNTIKIVENGMQLDSEYISLEETVTTGKVTPKDAENTISKVTNSPVNQYPDGNYYDVHAAFSPNQADYDSLPSFSIEKIQTLTLKDSSGKVLDQKKYSIVLTKTTITTTPIK